MAKRKKKVKTEKVDGLCPEDLARIRTAVRQVWTWSVQWRKAKARNIGKDGFPRCELCKKKVPKTYVDHMVSVGEVDSGFIERMFVSSIYLQNLCKDCHGVKTRKDNANLKANRLDFK